MSTNCFVKRFYCLYIGRDIYKRSIRYVKGCTVNLYSKAHFGPSVTFSYSILLTTAAHIGPTWLYEKDEKRLTMHEPTLRAYSIERRKPLDRINIFFQKAHTRKSNKIFIKINTIEWNSHRHNMLYL